MSARAQATVVVVPRQRFSFAARSLESVLAHTSASTPIVYVDGGSPPALRDWIRARARERGLALVRTDHYLAPNEARNLGTPLADTPYVVFVDNDVLVAPGWLERLVRCAEETGAWVVGPLYCIGEPAFATVHMAGGEVRLLERDGGRWLVDEHHLSYRPVAEVLPRLGRRRCTYAEFHAVLVRRDALERLGPLDEQLLSTPEHLDLCLLVSEAGGSIWFEPSSAVTYVPARRLAPGDVPFYFLRWSDRWNRASLDRLRAKWRLAPDDPFTAGHYMWVTEKRMLVLGPLWRILRAALGWRRSILMARALELGVTRFLIPDERERRRAHQAFRAAAWPAPPVPTGG